MAFKPVLPFIILWIPITRATLPSSPVSSNSIEKFSARNSTWDSLCSVVFDHVLHVNIIFLSHSNPEDISVVLKHLQHVARRSVSHWSAADGLPMRSDGTLLLNSIFRGTSAGSGFLVVLDDNTSAQLLWDFRLFWHRMRRFLTPDTPVIMLIYSHGFLKNCEDAENIPSLKLPSYYHAFIMLTSCPDRVFFSDLYDNRTMFYLTSKNLSIAHNILRELTIDMRGTTFRVAMAHFFPAAIFRNGTDLESMRGVDAYMLQTMARYFNFTPEIVLPKDGLPFGVYVNGTGSGTIKSVVQGEVDASFVGRFVMDYGTADFDYTTPYQFDSLCVVVPKNPPLSMYRMLFLSFEPKVWLFIAVVHVISAVVWLGIKSLWLSASYLSFVISCLDVYFLSASGTIVSSTLRAPSARFVAASLYFFNIVLIGTLQGMIYKFTTSPIQRQMRTLEELDASGFLIETIYEDLVNTFPQSSQQEVIQSLGTKVRLVSHESIWSWKPGKTPVAALLRRNPAALSLSDSANLNIALVEECPRNFFLSYIVKKNHKMLPFINQFISRCGEAGLIKKWLDDTYSVTNKSYDFRSKQSIHSKDASLEYVAGAVFILGSGLTASTALFLGELLFYVTIKNCPKLEKAFLKRCAILPH